MAFFLKKHQALPALVDVFNVAEWVFGILFLEARRTGNLNLHSRNERLDVVSGFLKIKRWIGI